MKKEHIKMLMICEYEEIKRGLETNSCPNCGGKLNVKDYRKRKWRTIYGKSRIYILRRLRCSHCKKLHTEIPDKLLPYKRYEMKAIEAIFNRKGAACVASVRTKKRWIRWCERFLKTFLLFFKTCYKNFRRKF